MVANMFTRTGTLGSSVVDSKTGVAHQALCSAVCHAILSNLRQTVLACADIHCGIAKEASLMLCSYAISRTPRTNALASVLANSPASITQQALRGAVCRAIGAGLRQTVLACADIRCGIAKEASLGLCS